MVAEASEAPQPSLAWLRELTQRHPGLIEAAATHSCTGGTHSRTRDGRIVCWQPPVGDVRVAVDAEVADQPVPGSLAHRWDTTDPEQAWVWWTATEVAAKLADVPILAWIWTEPPVNDVPVQVPAGQVWWTTGVQGGLRITYGFLQAAP